MNATLAPFIIAGWIALLAGVAFRWTSPAGRRARSRPSRLWTTLARLGRAVLDITRRRGSSRARALLVTYTCPHCGRELARKVRA